MKQPKQIVTGIGRFYKAVETEDYLFYCCYAEGDENGNVKMYRKDTMELVSDNYFAHNELFERMLKKDYIKVSRTQKQYYDAWAKEQDPEELAELIA
jgi:hypothetical protein